MIGNDPEKTDNLRHIDPGVSSIKTGTVRRAQRNKRRRYRYLRRHTPHYYLVLSGIAAAVTVCLLNTAAFFTHNITLSEVAFGGVLVATLVISSAFFWGFYMVMSGNIPVHRIKYFIPHGAVGFLSPLLYTLNLSLDLGDVGVRPISGLSLGCSVACLGLLGIQFAMGKAVVHTAGLRIVKLGE